MAEKKKKWVKNVTEHMDKGVFRKKAERAGKTTEAYAEEHEHSKGKIGKQARLAESLMAMSKAHKKHSSSSKEIMDSFYGKD